MPERPGAAPPADEEAIRGVNARWFGAMQAEDVEGLLPLLADDFLLKSPGAPPVADPAQLRSSP